MRNGSASAEAGETASGLLPTSAFPTFQTRSPLTHFPALSQRSCRRGAYLSATRLAARNTGRSILGAMIAQRRAPATGFPIETTVRDALYDRIPLGRPDIALIGTPAFARLERIQQLGFVSRVWPGARHTRFEHSLGVMHLTRLAIDHIRGNPEGRWLT